MKLANENDIELRQNYNLTSKKSLRKIGGYLNAKQMKRAKKEIKHFKALVGRIARDCKRKVAGSRQLEQIFHRILEQTEH